VKSNIQNPKPERIQKSEARNQNTADGSFLIRISGFGFLPAALSRRRGGPDFGFQNSDFQP
jgi:hypothetical protein